MTTFLVLAVAALALTVGILAAYIVLLEQTNRTQREALDRTGRAVGREHAAAEVLRAELEHLSTVAHVRNLWVARNAEMKTRLS